MCLPNWFFVLKYLPSGQIEHLKDLTSLWVAWCWSKCGFWEIFLSQIWQAKGFSPVWVLKCILRVDLNVNTLMQTSHLKACDS